jgi:predicted RNA-binding Zn ribbon-like protein
MNRSSKTSSTIVAPRRDLGIDFANTRYWRGSEPVETVHDFSEMVRWCDTNAMLGREAAERALQWSEKHGRDAAAIFDDAIALRETIYRICFALADGKTPEARDVAAINASLDRLDMAHRIRRGQPGNVGHRGARTQRQEHTFANDPSRTAVLQSDFNRSRSDEAAFAHHQFYTARRETLGVHLM